MATSKIIEANERLKLIEILKKRFEKNMNRHPELIWEKVWEKINLQPEKLWSLQQMESTGGEPDVIAYDTRTNQYVFMDCSAESPAGRRSLCYDEAALEARKEFKPANSAVKMAQDMGLELLSEAEYRALQLLGKFDTKTSSWLKTPESIRSLGGGIFGDYRYGQVFIYHNGVQSYYAARGFRAILRV